MKNIKQFEGFLNENDNADEHFKKAVAEAQDAFWAKIVELYPEIKTGDFPPDATFAFDTACEKALSIWLQGNRPAESEEQ